MYKFKTFLATLALIGLSIISASAQTVDVYVGGRDNGKATVWKNGTPQYYAQVGDISSIVVADGNIYAAGTEYVQEGAIGKVWKNGQEQYSFNSGTSASFIAVAGNDVYVAVQDWVLGKAKIWKNGNVESGYTGAKYLFSIFIDGSDIYAAGQTTDNNAAVWKNGNVLYALTSIEGGANAVFVDNGNVYVAGWECDSGNPNGVSKIWKNNVTLYTLETGGKFNNIVLALNVSNGVVYAAGTHYVVEADYACAALWTNGVLTELIDGKGKYGSYAYSMCVYDGNIYVAGTYDDQKALLWKNGTATALATGNNSVAESVFVAEKNSIEKLDFDTYAVTKWNNTFLLNLKKLAQEGYNATDCKWYKDGIKIGEGFSYSAGNNTTDLLETDVIYTFELNTSNNGTLFSSNKVLYKPLSVLRSYPNPASQGGRLTIEGIVKGNLVEMYDINGACIYRAAAAGNNVELTLNVQAGAYIVRSNNEEIKVIIK